MKLRIILPSLALIAGSGTLAACDTNDPQPQDTSEATFFGVGDESSDAHIVSGDGAVVVGTRSQSGETVRWVVDPAKGEVVDSQILAENSPDQIHGPWAASSDGSVVVGFTTDPQDPGFGGIQPFRWANGTMEHLGHLEDAEGPTWGFGASGDGDVVVGMGFNADGNSEAFRWEDGTMTRLGNVTEGWFLEGAVAVSADGSVIIGSGTNPGTVQEFFRLENGEVEGIGIPSLGGDQWGAARASVEASVVIGQAQNANGDMEAFRMKNGATVGLGDIPGGQFYSEALGVSADGSMVVGYGRTEVDHSFAERAFIWTEANGLRDLKKVLENEYNLDLSNWELTKANGISDDGMVIVGEGHYRGGEPHGTDSWPEGWVAYLGDPVSQ